MLYLPLSCLGLTDSLIVTLFFLFLQRLLSTRRAKILSVSRQGKQLPGILSTMTTVTAKMGQMSQVFYILLMLYSMVIT